MGFNLKKAVSKAVGNPVQAIQAANPLQIPQKVADGLGNAIGKNNELTKLAQQTATGTEDFKNAAVAAGQGDWKGVRKNLAAGAADGPSPLPVINPGDKTKNANGSDIKGFTPMAVSDAPTRGTYQSYQNADGTIQKQLSAASKFSPYTAMKSDAASAALTKANAAADSKAFTATGGPATAASLANSGKAQNYLTDRATTVGPSAWLNLQLQNQDLAKQNQLGNATAAAGGQQAASRSALATKGGLSSGAAERIAKTGSQDLTLQKQAILNQDQQARLNLGAQDEQTKTGLLGSAASLESGLSQFNAGQTQQNAQYNLGQNNQLAQFNAGQNQQSGQYNQAQANALNQYNATAANQNSQYNASNQQQNNQYNANSANNASQFNSSNALAANQFDISNALGEGAAKRADDLAYYQEKMKDRAAGINANAIGQAGTGGGKKLGG